MRITDKVLRSFKVARKYDDVHTGKINCVDYSSNGENAVSSSDDDSITLYDIQQGKPIVENLFSKKYGVDLIRFTPRDSETVVHSSNKQDDTIRYLSITNYSFLRYFSGHTARVTALSMSPVEDIFISSSLDETIRIWDLRLPTCQGLTNTMGRPVCSFDPDGLVFAAGVESRVLKLYDLRAFDRGPFSCFETRFNRVCDWTGLKFSRDGKHILICTNGGAIRILNSFSGSVQHTFSGYNNSKGVSLEACFTPDSQFVMIGSEDGRVHVWSIESGMKVAVLDGKHQGPINTLQFNSLYMTFASACTSMMFWLPCGDDF